MLFLCGTPGVQSANLTAFVALTHSFESLKQVAADHFLILCVQIQFKLDIKLLCPSQVGFVCVFSYTSKLPFVLYMMFHLQAHLN